MPIISLHKTFRWFKKTHLQYVYIPSAKPLQIQKQLLYYCCLSTEKKQIYHEI